jgi:hypothetical protein
MKVIFFLLDKHELFTKDLNSDLLQLQTYQGEIIPFHFPSLGVTLLSGTDGVMVTFVVKAGARVLISAGI